ncbi:hypothetical protein [Paraflavitalea speifideaquila]|uniref:hypothetical protein n=1 Tax=Paraflavitalea speifideaquila TaxID=3076558 RepID=UPI0028EA5C70|nr:hypothetical protein [Paraflavitalea speifideiaquila]
MIPIDINLTLKKLKGPTQEQIITFNQWAIVALERYHPNETAAFEFEVDGIRHSSKLIWDNQFSRSAMREKVDMANFGGVAIAMFVMAVFLNYSYVEQTEIGDGVDYKFLENEPDENDLNFLAGGHYVEASGILEETGTNTLAARLKTKHQQITRGKKIKKPHLQ